MLTEKGETEPNLVAIRSGNGAGLFLQPCSPQGAATYEVGHPAVIHARVHTASLLENAKREFLYATHRA